MKHLSESIDIDTNKSVAVFVLKYHIVVRHLSSLALLCADTMKSKALFDKMTAAVKTQGADLVKMGGAVFQFVISDGGAEGKFVLDLKNGSGKAEAGEDASADCTITIADADMVAMADGSLDGMQAFMSGKLKIKGNMMLAQKLAPILEAAQK